MIDPDGMETFDLSIEQSCPVVEDILVSIFIKLKFLL